MLLTDAQVAKLLKIRQRAISLGAIAYDEQIGDLAEMLAEALDEISKASRRRRREKT